MRTIKYLKRLYCRRLLFRSFRWYLIFRLLATIIFLFLLITFSILFYYCVLVYYLNSCCYFSLNVIVSLTTTPKRFQYELPITIHSLLTQTELPKEIRIYLSPIAIVVNQTNLTLKHLKISVKHIDSSKIISQLFDKLVRIQLEAQDYGPATKYLPIIKEYHKVSPSQSIIICDDDHYYHPYMVSLLYKYSNKYQNSIVGFRGWRSKKIKKMMFQFIKKSFLVREDLVWGVAGRKEASYHIVEAFHISEMYRVGIVTANYGYLIRPSYFDSHIYEDFDKVLPDIRRVDDIWINGHASKRNISRFIIPASCSSISMTQTHELENYLRSHQMTRSTANGHALVWFKEYWEKNLWYRYRGENAPKYRNLLTIIYRECLMIFLRVKCFIYSGSM